MYKSNTNVSQLMGNFQIEDRMFRYSSFVPKLVNYCKSLGFEPGKIMPSRAFCSDENQGYPIILISKHFGTFPFNHGQVGGVVATDRNGPHAEHGKDLLIIQASHVGYDPDTKQFGTYRRMCTEDHEDSPTCGKIAGVLGWYQAEYEFAMNNIMIRSDDGQGYIIIDNQLMDYEREEGLFLHKDKLIMTDQDELIPVESYSTSKCFRLKPEITQALSPGKDKQAIGEKLLPEYFFYKRIIKDGVEGQTHLELNLLNIMPWIVTDEAPMLAAAKVNTQVEFDRTFRTIIKEQGYQGKRVLYITGLHIDISPQEGQIFPLTKFIPWAAFIQHADGSRVTLEQDELYTALNAQSDENPDQINMDDAIRIMERLREVKIV